MCGAAQTGLGVERIMVMRSHRGVAEPEGAPMKQRLKTVATTALVIAGPIVLFVVETAPRITRG